MIFFSSDHHFWHNNIIQYCGRPYASTEVMNEDLVLRWNSKVGPFDDVFYLGDFSLAFRPVEVYPRRLNGVKHLVYGNHDFCHPAHKKSRTPENQAIWIKKYLENGFTSAEQHKLLTLESIGEVRLSHLPYLEPDTQEDQRHSRHRPVDDGKILLCGHVHEKWTTRRTGKGTLMVNIGVDRWGGYPVSLTQLQDLLSGVSSLERGEPKCLSW